MAPKSRLPKLVLSHLDALPVHSAALLAASDELVAAIYPPQKPSSIILETLAFEEVIKALESSLYELVFPDKSLEESLAGMDLAGSDTVKKNSKTWFDTCFAQIYKTAGVIRIAQPSTVLK